MFTRAGSAGNPADQRRITGGVRASRLWFYLRHPPCPCGQLKTDDQSSSARSNRPIACMIMHAHRAPKRPNLPRTGSSGRGCGELGHAMWSDRSRVEGGACRSEQSSPRHGELCPAEGGLRGSPSRRGMLTGCVGQHSSNTSPGRGHDQHADSTDETAFPGARRHGCYDGPASPLPVFMQVTWLASLTGPLLPGRWQTSC